MAGKASAAAVPGILFGFSFILPFRTEWWNTPALRQEKAPIIQGIPSGGQSAEVAHYRQSVLTPLHHPAVRPRSWLWSFGEREEVVVVEVVVV